MKQFSTLCLAWQTDSVTSAVSLGKEELSLGLAALVDRVKGRSLILVVNQRIDIDLCDSGDLIEGKHVFDVLVERRHAHCVQILADFDFLLRQAIELLIVQAHGHFIVDV